MAAPRRERRVNSLGVTELRCFCETHKGKWLAEDCFGKTTYRIKSGERRPIKQAYCREYYRINRQRIRNPNRQNPGTVPISSIKSYLERIVVICGSYNAAARTLGISTTTIYRWLGRSNCYRNKNIYKTSVHLILVTLKGLESGEIKPAVSSKRSGRIFQHGCRGCGTELHNYTVGCKACDDRRRKREARGFDFELDLATT